MNIRHTDERYRKCHQLFKTSNYETHKNRNPDRVEGTCQWVLKHQQYQSWLTSRRDNLLWISADPGCGKSVLSKTLIKEEIKSHASRSTCYFFFKDNEEQNSLSIALCALLHQLFSYRPRLLRHAIPYWDREGEKMRNETARLWQVLLLAGTDPAAGDVVCILDALDECAIEGQVDLIDFLTSFYNSSITKTSRQSTLKFLVTSRPYYGIERQFHRLRAGLPTIRLAGEDENEQIGTEIDLVTNAWVSDLSTELNLKASLRELLQVRLQQIRSRTYLWLYLVFQEIRKSLKQTEKMFNSIIDEIPTSIDEAYDHILSKSTDQKEAAILLKIIVGAARPLTLKEMDVAFALATQENVSSYEELDLDGDNLKRRIRNLCGLFVYIADSRVQLFHQTAKEFLLRRDVGFDSVSNTWRHSLEERGSEFLMAETCMRYLLFDAFETGNEDYDSEFEETDRPDETKSPAHDFMDYSAANWPEHFRKADVGKTDHLFSLSLALSDTKSPHYAVWFPNYWRSEQRYSGVPEWTSLHLAGYVGHTEVVRHLLDHEKMSVDSKNREGTTAFISAAARGHLAVVQLLLDRGAEIRQRTKSHDNALWAASAEGHEKVVQLLLDRGVEFDIAKTGNCAPLQAASGRGHEKVVEKLLQFIAQTDDQDLDTRQTSACVAALVTASENGHEKVVELLLGKGAQIKIQKVDAAHASAYAWSLQQATRRRHEKVVELLLEKGTDLDTQGACHSNIRKALSRWRKKMWKEHEQEISGLLLDESRRLNAR